MKQLEKEINIAGKHNMEKRYKMYNTSLSKLIEKEKSEVKKEKKGYGV